MWDTTLGACKVECSRLTSTVACASDPMCTYDGSASQCKKQCSARNTSECTQDTTCSLGTTNGGTVCKNKCEMRYTSAVLCNQDPECMYDSTVRGESLAQVIDVKEIQ